MITLEHLFPRKISHGMLFSCITLTCIIASLAVGFIYGNWSAAYVLSLCALTLST